MANRPKAMATYNASTISFFLNTQIPRTSIITVKMRFNMVVGSKATDFTSYDLFFLVNKLSILLIISMILIRIIYSD